MKSWMASMSLVTRLIEIARARFAVLEERQPLDALIQQESQVVRHPLADRRGQVLFEVGADRADHRDQRRRRRARSSGSRSCRRPARCDDGHAPSPAVRLGLQQVVDDDLDRPRFQRCRRPSRRRPRARARASDFQCGRSNAPISSLPTCARRGRASWARLLESLRRGVGATVSRIAAGATSRNHVASCRPRAAASASRGCDAVSSAADEREARSVAMSDSAVPLVIGRRRFGETARRDAWWVQPLVVFAGLSTFIVYATWAAFQNAHYTFGNYLSPFYSPELFGSPEAWFGPKPAFLPAWLPFSPALVILPIPAFFRVTCYYYRGAYYKAFWGDPPSCTVGEPAQDVLGREFLSADSAKRPSLHAVPVDGRSARAVLRRVEGAVVRESTDRRPGVRHRRRHARPGHERRAAERVSASAVIPCGTSRADAPTSCRARRSGCAPTTA